MQLLSRNKRFTNTLGLILTGNCLMILQVISSLLFLDFEVVLVAVQPLAPHVSYNIESNLIVWVELPKIILSP